MSATRQSERSKRGISLSGPRVWLNPCFEEESLNLLFGDLYDDRDGHFATVYDDGCLIVKPFLDNLNTAISGVRQVFLDSVQKASNV